MIVRNLSRSLSYILLPNLFLWASCSNSNFSGDGKAKSNQGKTITPGSDGQPTDKLSTEEGDAGLEIAGLPKFGLLVNDPECAFCHVRVTGDVVSTRSVPPLWGGSLAKVDGTWKVKGTFNPTLDIDGKNTNKFDVAKGISTDYSVGDVPAAFPAIVFDSLDVDMKGIVESPSNAVKVDKVSASNVVLIGTKDKPIKINKDVLIHGDLIIKGYYTGVGTIYVTGNIYIPFDLQSLNAVFPYPDNAREALTKAEGYVKDSSKDGLGLATKKSIFIADLEVNGTSEGRYKGATIYNHKWTPANRGYTALGVLDVYNWYPGGKAEYNKLYGDAVVCSNARPGSGHASFNIVDAFLFAQNTISGVARNSSYSIRGGVIADYFHIISGAGVCDSSKPAPHGRPSNLSYIEYDYRFKTGRFPVLEHLGKALEVKN